ncbi:MAG: amidase family protein [Mycobacteriales bacterium]|nr:amidase family protein [Mycobacteriales bacterium]
MRTTRLLPLVAGLLLTVTAIPSEAAPRFAGSPACDTRAKVAGLDLQTATAADLQAAMRAGRLTSVRLVDAYLARIKAYDAKTNSIRALHPKARAEAARLDAERRAGKVRGPLHGIPLLLKDNIGTKDLPTTAGSIALEGSVPFQDSTVVARLRAAGAIVLGKANLSEWANWVDLSMPNGYSSLGGQVLSAYDFGDPLGSSSGSGVAGSMAFATGTFGSETSGSILSPASVNGLVGIKPTRGLVSRSGVIPLAEGFDTAGPMTRTVADAAALLTAVAGPDAADNATSDAPAGVDFAAAARTGSLNGVRLGFSAQRRDGLGGPAREVYDAALDTLRAQGAVLVETEELEDLGQLGIAEIGLIPNDFKAHLDAYLTTAIPTPKSGVRSLVDVVAYNQQFPDKVKYGQRLLIASAAQPGVRELAQAGSLGLRTAMGEVIDRALEADDLDAVVVHGPAYANVGASAGYPTVIVPAGLVNDEDPVGLSFLGSRYADRALVGYASAYERASRKRVPPTRVNDEIIPGC